MDNLKGILLLSAVLILLLPVSFASGSSCHDDNDLTAFDFQKDLTSPGYLFKYPRNIACVWRIVARDPNKKVVMETAEIMLHVGSDCDINHDALAVYYDETNVSTTLCGQDRRMIISPGNSMYLVFNSDDTYEDKGFKVRYYQADARTPCNFELTASATYEDSFSSPGYPGGYFNDLECNYTIRTQWAGHRIEIEVIDSDIEDATHCQYDRLTVVDQNNETEQILGTICGTERSRYQSSGTSLQVQFVSNSRKVNKGFRITYKSVDIRKCRVPLHAARMDSFLVSPGYPYHYYSNLTCDWVVGSSDNRTVELSLIRSNIAGHDPNCTGDKLLMSNSDATDVDSVFCGNETASFKNIQWVWISLYTDGYVEDHGFLLRYRLQQDNITLVPCGGKLEVNSSRQILQSPLYPDTLLLNQTCVWNLTAANPNEIIMVSLVDLDIEMSTECEFDRLSIYNDSSVLDSKVLETWCGQRGGEVIYSTGPYLTIIYKVDDSNNGRGFSLTYSTVSGTKSTLETFHLKAKDTISYLSSPGFPNYFPRNQVFSYIFTAAEGDKIKLEVTRSSLPGNTITSPNGCTSDTKAIAYDGPTNSAPRLPSIYSQYFTWCGQDMPLYVSSNNSMLLEYHTGSQGNKDVGFELEYKQSSYAREYAYKSPKEDVFSVDLKPLQHLFLQDWWFHECGGWLKATSTQKNLTSPHYPAYYWNNMLCRWVIRASTNGSMIRLTGLAISLQGDNVLGNCSYDSITLYDGSETPGNRKDVWCGSMSKIFQTKGSLLTIVFKTDESITHAGFRFGYFETTDPPPCLKSLAVTSGTRHVKTPGYDQHTLPPNKTCTWIFSRYSSYITYTYIKLDVTSFAGGINKNQSCSSSRIEVYDGMSDSSPLIGRFCGGDPKTYIGSKASMLVKMITGPSPVSEGFSIAYRAGLAELCGNKYRTAHLNDTILTSPFYPAQYPNNMQCIWVISSDELDYIILVEVLVSDVEYTEHCGKDYLTVYDGYTTTSPLIDRWCGKHTQKYQSTGGALTVEFHTDKTVSKSGFKLKYWKKYHPSRYYDPDTDVAVIVGSTLGGTFGFLAIISIIIIVVHRKSKYRASGQPTTSNVPFTNQQMTVPSVQGYTNNTYGGESSSYIASLSTTHTGGKSPHPEYSSLATGDITTHHYEGIQSGTQANGGTKSDHPPIDNNDESKFTKHSTNM